MKFQLNIGLSFIITKYSKPQNVSCVYNTLEDDRDHRSTTTKLFIAHYAHVHEATLKMRVLELHIQTKMVESYWEQLVSSP
jgi:hypothetical protein